MRFFRILFFLFLPFLGLQAQNIPVFEINDPAINKKGKIFFKSTDGFTFSGDLAPVALKDISGQTQIGFINKGGKLVVPAQFDGLGDFSQGYYEVRKNGKYGLINAAGQTVEDYQYKGLKFQDNEHILATHFISWQIKDNFNKVIEKVEADSIVAISDSAYKIFLNGQIFPLRQQKKRPASAALAEELSKKESFPYTTWFYKGKIAYENLECNLVVPPVYDSVKYVPEERIFMVYWKDKIGILEYDGTEIMPLTNKYKKIYSFVNGRARMLRDGRYGFIDRYANVRVAPQYENVQDFSEGYAAVFLAGKWGFVDQNEKLVVQPFYSEVKPFTFGTARVKEKNRWSFVNPSGEKITSTPYDEIFPSDHKKWVVVSNKKFGLADSTGREILGPKYESIRDLNNGYVIVRKNGKWGVLDYQENFVIPIESDFMGYDPFNNYFFTGIAEKDEILQVKGGGKK